MRSAPIRDARTDGPETEQASGEADTGLAAPLADPIARQERGTAEDHEAEDIPEHVGPLDLSPDAEAYVDSLREGGLPGDPVVRRFGPHVVWAGPSGVEVMVYRATRPEAYGASTSWWGRNVSSRSRQAWLHWEVNQGENRDYCYMVELLRYPPSEARRYMSVLDRNINVIIAAGIADLGGALSSGLGSAATQPTTQSTLWAVADWTITGTLNAGTIVGFSMAEQIERLLPDPGLQLGSNSYAAGLSAEERHAYWQQAQARFPSSR